MVNLQNHFEAIEKLGPYFKNLIRTARKSKWKIKTFLFPNKCNTTTFLGTVHLCHKFHIKPFNSQCAIIVRESIHLQHWKNNNIFYMLCTYFKDEVRKEMKLDAIKSKIMFYVVNGDIPKVDDTRLGMLVRTNSIIYLCLCSVLCVENTCEILEDYWEWAEEAVRDGYQLMDNAETQTHIPST